MKNFLILTVAVIFSPVFLRAQTADPELDYIKNAYSKEKKTIVDEYMGLNVQEGAKFWAIYADYESKREKLAMERVKLIQEYVGYTDNITAEQADKTANAALTNTLNLSKINLEYYGKMRKAIGAVRAAKFMQLETYLQSAWRSVVQDNIPLISELDKTQKN
jgi:hypothetical protein